MCFVAFTCDFVKNVMVAIDPRRGVLSVQNERAVTAEAWSWKVATQKPLSILLCRCYIQNSPNKLDNENPQIVVLRLTLWQLLYWSQFHSNPPDFDLSIVATSCAVTAVGGVGLAPHVLGVALLLQNVAKMSGGGLLQVIRQ